MITNNKKIKLTQLITFIQSGNNSIQRLTQASFTFTAREHT
jgi:hypothetical protein